MTFPFPFIIPTRRGGVELEYITSQPQIGTGNFGTVSIGTPSEDRLVIAMVMCEANASRSVNSITIDGVASSLVVATNSGLDPAGIGTRIIPSGTSAPITWVASGSAGFAVCHIFTLKGYLSLTPVDVGQSSSSSATSGALSLTSQEGGAAIFGNFHTNGNDASWTGAADMYGYTNTYRWEAASITKTPTGSITAIPSWSGSSRYRTIGACWR